MRSPQLQAAVGDFLAQAAAALQADVHAGHEVPFELASHSPRSRGSSPLYCYRPLTSPYIAERFPDLSRLEGYQQAVVQLERSDGLERYITSLGAPDRSPQGTHHRRADVALLALLRDVFDEQSDFELRPERLQRALDRLDGPTYAEADEVTLVATLHGLTISSPELPLARGLTIAHPGVLPEAPAQALWAEGVGWDGNPGWHGSGGSAGSVGGARSTGSAGSFHEQDHLLAVFRADSSDTRAAIAQGSEVLRELLRALRLFGDGRIALGPLAHARIGTGSWSTIALGTAGHPHGMLLVGSHQEDELRAFCNLVSRRAPHSSAVAWALQRFELGCERHSEYEGLSDHILALRTLLAAPAGSDPGVSPDGLLAGRLAALCATPERRSFVAARTLKALVLERHAIAGTAVERASGLAVARELADHLRALLRDVICGHLPAYLTSLADELLLSGAEAGAGAGAEEEEAEAVGQGADSARVGRQAGGGVQSPSGEQSLGDERQPSEILHVAV